jgi:nucleotide-binding universal stress UspA family protein
MYRRILVPTDGSPTSERALEHAARLAQPAVGGASPAAVTILLAADPRDLRPLGSLPSTPRAEEALRVMEQVLQEADAALLARAQEILHARGVAATTKRIEGAPAAVIAAEAGAGGYDLIVMGSRGLRLKDEASDLLGSVTERVLRRVACPVLVVKQTPVA